MATQYQDRNRPEKKYDDKVVVIKRVSKKTKGGNQISFTALVVSGDKKSKVGVGLGKAKSVAGAIKKAIQKAQKKMITVPIVNGTIPHMVNTKFKAGRVLIRPGKKGSGVIAGGPVRIVVEAAGVQDIASKIIGSRNKSINVWTAFKALSLLKK